MKLSKVKKHNNEFASQLMSINAMWRANDFFFLFQVC